MFSIIIYIVGILYLSVCIGFYLKMGIYGVKEEKFIKSLYGPVIAIIAMECVAWQYISEAEKKEKIRLNLLGRMYLMMSLTKLNIQIFPAILGIIAMYFVEVEKRMVPNTDAAKKRQSYRRFRSKSYQVYDDYRRYGFI